jgi:ADP-ribose pyrophosphatase YjhB (NUDIX family)
MKFCPRCATPLEISMIGGRDRPRCPAEGCGFIFFGDFSIGCAGVVIRDSKVLLVQRGHNPGKGSWQIPGGYVEADEEVALAVVRECEEETGVRAEVVDVLGFRHSIGGGGSIGGPSTNIYIMFRLRPLGGEPKCDGDEVAQVGYFSLEEIERMERVQSLSKWAIQRALEAGDGFVPAYRNTDPARPGWTIFGIPLPEGIDQVAVAPAAPAVPAAPPEAKPPTVVEAAEAAKA